MFTLDAHPGSALQSQLSGFTEAGLLKPRKLQPAWATSYHLQESKQNYNLE